MIFAFKSYCEYFIEGERSKKRTVWESGAGAGELGGGGLNFLTRVGLIRRSSREPAIG